MALTIAGAVAGTAALAAYLDARFLIRNDLSLGSKAGTTNTLARFLERCVRDNKMRIYNIFEDRASTPLGQALFLIYEDRQWTYAEFFKAIQFVANWLMKDLGVKRGEIVALDGGNTPEYLLTIFALEAIGAAPALINCNLTSKPLVHCVELCKCRLILADERLRNLVSPVETELKEAGTSTYYYSQSYFATLNDNAPLPELKDFSPLEPGAIMYTSGTTGLPKGTILTRGRMIGIGFNVGGKLRLGPGQTMYTCLPLYHATALAMCIWPCIHTGAAVALSYKFSHSTFWPAVHKSKATHIQYVGELSRYLVNAPPGPLDRGHNVRVAWGNGMRPDVWDRFRDRFGIEEIHELYGATDGMAGMTNSNRGHFSRYAIAVRGPIWHLLNPQEKRILVDTDTQEILRGKDGFAIEVKHGEPGETVIQMDPEDPDRGSPVYFNNRAATDKRRVKDLFKRGDLWWRSGDLMRLDSEGRVFFVDRLGDTFRWRSENVSTNEVSDVVGRFPQIAEANIYGVLVPGMEGRAGCAAIVPTQEILSGNGELGWAAFAEHCLSTLPRYAVPLFLRLTKSLDYTGTHKLQKQKMRAEGIDMSAITAASPDDRMYWLQPGSNSYVPFKEKDWNKLKAGQVRL
ncbi:fatty-acyl-CoA synthase [Xylariaceae sp. FL0255]|nr:fatty-acyl-CoA synthase [Xylariaceae sp. FL0255]